MSSLYQEMELMGNHLQDSLSLSGKAAYAVAELVRLVSEQQIPQAAAAVTNQKSLEAVSSSSSDSSRQKAGGKLRRNRAKLRSSSFKKPALETIVTRSINPTTFVQVDSSSFSRLVQELTGAGSNCKSKMPVTSTAIKGSSRQLKGAQLQSESPSESLEQRLEKMLNVLAPGRNKKTVSPDSTLQVDRVFGSPCSSSDMDCSYDSQVDGTLVEQGSRSDFPRLLDLFPVNSD